MGLKNINISTVLNHLNPLGSLGYRGMRVILDEHATKETITYSYLHPVIGGHIWISSSILRDSIVIIDAAITGQPIALMNRATWDSLNKELYYESS